MNTDLDSAKREKAWQQMLVAQGVEDSRGFGLMRALMASAHMLEVVADHDLQAIGLSVPRMRLLTWLFVEEQHGSTAGMSPSHLSHYQHISKNTVSSLLGSLEEQGLIERTLSSEDKRSFQIRLTRKGRELVHATLPTHNSSMTEAFAALTAEEQKTLLKILHKLRQSLTQQIGQYDLSSYKTSLE
jgi:DNA-binding MarR family transcriptional regulator